MNIPKKTTHYQGVRILKRVAHVRMAVPEGLVPTIKALIANYTTAPLSELERLQAERAKRTRALRNQQMARYRRRLKAQGTVT